MLFVFKLLMLFIIDTVWKGSGKELFFQCGDFEEFLTIG